MGSCLVAEERSMGLEPFPDEVGVVRFLGAEVEEPYLGTPFRPFFPFPFVVVLRGLGDGAGADDVPDAIPGTIASTG